MLLSVLFNWLPKLREWYATKDDTAQRLIMLASLAAAALLVFGANCASFQLPGVDYSTTCDVEGAKQLAQIFVNAVVANQVAFLVLPKPK